MKIILKYLFEFVFFFILALIAIRHRFRKKKYDVGLGPDPLINNIYHQKALSLYNYSSKTFVKNSFYITNEFDIDVSIKFKKFKFLKNILGYIYLCIKVFNFKVIYINFNGGPIGLKSNFLWKIEPLLYKISRTKTLLLPYGSDVQDLTRSKNLEFKDAYAIDYPNHKFKRNIISKKIDLWTKNSDHIMGGCEWVDYLYHWDSLTLSHFSYDIPQKTKSIIKKDNKNFKVLHAPNHRNIKGTDFLIKAIEDLKEEGYLIELILIEKKSNQEVIKLINQVDLVADQFIIGWYAMFAIEAMAHSKPVIGYLRDDLISFYCNKDLIEKDEIPILNSNVGNIKQKLRWCLENKDELKNIGDQSYNFVKKHHSLEYIGSLFNKINKDLGI